MKEHSPSWTKGNASIWLCEDRALLGWQAMRLSVLPSLLGSNPGHLTFTLYLVFKNSTCTYEYVQWSKRVFTLYSCVRGNTYGVCACVRCVHVFKKTDLVIQLVVFVGPFSTILAQHSFHWKFLRDGRWAAWLGPSLHMIWPSLHMRLSVSLFPIRKIMGVYFLSGKLCEFICQKQVFKLFL